MNEQRFDELFRDKLENYSEMPSPEAFTKLDSKLNERKRGAWLNFAKLAAALIIVAVSVYIVRSWDNAPPTQITEQTTYHNLEQSSGDLKENLQTPSAFPEANDPDKFYETIDQESADVSKKPIKAKSEKANSQFEVLEPKNAPEQKTKNQSKAVQDISSPALALAKESPELLDIEQLEPSDQQNLSETESVKIPRPKVTITYKKSPAPPEPTLALEAQSNQQPKGLKKVWRKAVSNYGEISLAGIRGTKDQLLAFERKNKTKESKSN